MDMNNHYITELATPSTSQTDRAANVAFVLAQTGSISSLNLQQINSANPLTSNLDLSATAYKTLVNDGTSGKQAVNYS